MSISSKLVRRIRAFNQAQLIEPTVDGVPFSTAAILSSGIRSSRSEKFAMRRHPFPSTSAPSALGGVRRGPTIESLWIVNQRLANAERELRVQFTRIAQLQAQLDVVLGALRRSPDGVHV